MAFFDAATERADAMIANPGLAITLLQERCSALISAAVTGRIDVRGLPGSESASALADCTDYDFVSIHAVL